MLDLTQVRLIQAGMGVNISCPGLARAVSPIFGCLGTVSGTALHIVVDRLAQRGDADGSIRLALDEFSAVYPEVALELGKRWAPYFDRLVKHDEPFIRTPYFEYGYTDKTEQLCYWLTVFGNYWAVKTAKRGHDGPVAINYLTEIDEAHGAAIYGAMLAGVDAIVAGAGIPKYFPSIFRSYFSGEVARYRGRVVGGEGIEIVFDPKGVLGHQYGGLAPPAFMPIVASTTLARMFSRMNDKGERVVHGLVVENETAGGHNAPPRDKPVAYNGYGEPLYSLEANAVDFAELQALGLPFFLAGSYGASRRLYDAEVLGAQGIQVGSRFALCEESGMDPAIRQRVRELASRGELVVRRNPRISPTGFPFNAVNLEGLVYDTGSMEANRKRRCDVCQLQHRAIGPTGELVHICPAEPLASHRKKGGRDDDTDGRGCVCNGLLATAGLGQPWEPPMVTLGSSNFTWLRGRPDPYTAMDVVRSILGYEAAEQRW